MNLILAPENRPVKDSDTPLPAHAAADAAPRPGDHYVQSFARGLEVIRSFSDQAPQQTL